MKLAVTAVACAAWWAVLEFGVSLGATQTPPLGAFLNPWEGFYRAGDANYYLDTERLPGLRAPVEVVYDDRLVPHLYAATESDLYYAQGFVQAQHRMFQLELTARSAEGTLSEVLGTRTLALDRERRRTGGGQLADAIDSLWRGDPRAYAAVERYADGVNAYLAGLEPHEYPIEYRLLDFAPSPWSPRATALVALNMAYTLNAANDDVAATRTRELVGERAFDFLFPERDPRADPVIPRGTPFWRGDSALIRASEAQRLGDGVGAASPPRIPDGNGGYAPYPEGVGSNNWVVAGSRTATGKPLLANDPHLGLTLPSIWFESELHAGDLHVHGVSLPGVPGVTIGFNEDVAWGVTNVGTDVLDWRPVDWLDADQTRYRREDGTTGLVTYRTERIAVRDGEEVVERVPVTDYGPIVHRGDDHRAGMALDWLTLRRPSAQAVQTFLGLNHAESLSDFLAASRAYEWPAQNMVFANDDGDIALRVSGLLPRRLPGQGRFLRSTGTPGATGFLANDANPLAVNPAQGYLASANQVSTDASYPYYYTGGYDVTRSRRINALLRADSSVSLADAKAFQTDTYFEEASELLPIMLRRVRADDLSLSARGQLDVLRGWDYRYGAGDFAPVIYELWREALAELTWDEFAVDGPVLRPRTWRLADLLADDPLSRWFDRPATTDEREDARDIVTLALERVSPRIDSLSNVAGYDWAQRNGPAIRHLVGIGPFSREGLDVGGRAGTLLAQRGSVGPSWRMIVALGAVDGTLPRAEVAYPGGQSGRPGHAHYADMVDAWSAGEYFTVTLKRSPADASWDDADVTRLTLEPGTLD